MPGPISSGIDQLSYSVSWSLELIKRSTRNPDPQEFARQIESHNECYARFFRFFFETVYLDKYATMGDHDLMTAELLIDTCYYYFFNVWPAYRGRDPYLLQPPYYPPAAKYGKPFLGFPHRRLVAIARRKLKLGIYGNHNAGRRPKIIGFTLGLGTVLTFLKGLRYWLQAEAANAWTYIIRPRPRRDQMPTPMTDPARQEARSSMRAPASGDNPGLESVTVDGKAAQRAHEAGVKSKEGISP